MRDQARVASEIRFGGVSHGLRIGFFATKKFFAESAFAVRRRSPSADSGAIRLGPIRGDLTSGKAPISRHRE
jgi:hypothetical protein